MRGHKYHAIPTVVDNVRFDSKKEAAHYQGLKLLQLAGAISDLELQPRFKLYATSMVKGTVSHVCTYVADFQYTNQANGEVVVADVKGVRTAMYRLKKKWVEAQFGITITEV